MEPSESNIDAARAREHQRAASLIIGQLEQRDIIVLETDRAEDLADLLSAVERFEQAVAMLGGDSMRNAPDSALPERREFVIPRRADDEGTSGYTRRVDDAAARLFASRPLT